MPFLYLGGIMRDIKKEKISLPSEKVKKDKEVRKATALVLVNSRRDPSLKAQVIKVRQPQETIEIKRIVGDWIEFTDGTYSLGEYFQIK
jgi:hypothetical protein